MHKGNKGKNITISTNYTPGIQNGTFHITDAVRDYMTHTPFFHPQDTEYCQITCTVQ